MTFCRLLCLSMGSIIFKKYEKRKENLTSIPKSISCKPGSNDQYIKYASKLEVFRVKCLLYLLFKHLKYLFSNRWCEIDTHLKKLIFRKILLSCVCDLSPSLWVMYVPVKCLNMYERAL